MLVKAQYTVLYSYEQQHQQSNGPPGWQIVLSSRLGCLHCVVAAGGEGKAGAGAEDSVEYSG